MSCNLLYKTSQNWLIYIEFCEDLGAEMKIESYKVFLKIGDFMD